MQIWIGGKGFLEVNPDSSFLSLQTNLHRDICFQRGLAPKRKYDSFQFSGLENEIVNYGLRGLVKPK